MPEWSTNQIEKREVSELQPYARNPRNHPAEQIEQIKNSIRQWGWTMPILIDENNVVLAGHGRLQAATEMLIDEVPCVIAQGWSEEEKQAYVIADNQLAENSNWNTGLYFQQMKELEAIGFDLSLTGLDKDTISSLSFEPNLQPNFGHQDVTKEDISSVQERLETITPKSVQITDVTCPHCGEDFSYQGQ